MPTRMIFFREYQGNEKTGLFIQRSITRLLHLRLVSSCALILAGYKLTNENSICVCSEVSFYHECVKNTTTSLKSATN